MSATFPEAAKDVADAFTPRFALHVSWNGALVKEGEKLTPGAVKDIPDVCFEGDKDKLYTVCLADPDAPNPTEPKFACWIHW